MLPVIFNIEHDKQKEKTIKVNKGHPIKTNGLASMYILSLYKYSKNNIPKEAEAKNITPTAKVRDITDSPLQYFLIRIILHAKKKPAIRGSICNKEKFSDHGSKINKAPELPKINAKILHILILSLRKIIAKKETKIGKV